MGRRLLLRFHALGDVVLTAGIVSALSRRGGSIEFATDARFLELFRGLDGISRLWSRAELESEGAQRSEQFDEIFDLQATPSSGRLARALLRPGGALRRLRSRSAARRWICLWGERFPRPRIPHALERYAEAAGLEGTLAAALRPSLPVQADERASARALAPAWMESDDPRPRVALLTGASRRTKAWPIESFREVEARLTALGVAVLGVRAPQDETAPTSWLSAELPALKAILSRAQLAIGNDSGPLHLASAVGAPVLALFGSSSLAFGFGPVGPEDAILQVPDLACRPCGVHGRDRCWQGHWRCLTELSPAQVVEAARRKLPLPGALGDR